MKPKRLTIIQRGLTLLILLSLALSGMGGINLASHAAPIADPPELFATAQLEGMNIYGNTIYWHASCGDDFSPTTSILRSKPTSAAASDAAQTLYSHECPTADRIASANVAIDDTNIYWLGGDGGVFSLPRTATAATMPTQLGHTITAGGVGGFPSCCSIAVDTTNIFWNEGKKVYRVAKSGGDGTLIYDGGAGDPNPGSSIRDLQTSGDGSVYFLLGTKLTMLQASGSSYAARLIVDNATTYALDSARVYWASKPAGSNYAIMSQARDFTDLQTHYTNSDVTALSVDNLAVDTTNIYWHDARPGAGRIYKLARSGGAPVALTGDMSIGAPLLTDGTYLFWTDYNTGIFRLQVNATPLPPADGDIWVTGMEVTQAIQTDDNQIPLVGYKTTVVRVYVQSREDSNGPWSGVTARLQVSGSSRFHSSRAITVSPSGSNHATLDDSFYFLLSYDETAPDTSARPGRDLTVTLIPPLGRPESNTDNDTLTQHVNFGPERDMTIYGYTYGNLNNGPTCTDGFGASGFVPPVSAFEGERQYLENVYPVSSLTIRPLVGSGTRLFDNSSCGAVDAAKRDSNDIVSRTFTDTQVRALLLLPDAGPINGNELGWCCDRAGSSYIPWITYEPDNPGWIAAQEIAHSYGGVLGTHTFDPAFGYPRRDTGGIGPWVGIKLAPTPHAIPGTNSDGSPAAWDYMSYSSQPRWVSPYTYCKSLNYMSNGATLCPSTVEGGAGSSPLSLATGNAAASIQAAPVTDEPAPYIYIAGTINPNGSAIFRSFEIINSATPLANAPKGQEYHLLLEDANGKMLAQQDFALGVSSLHPNQPEQPRDFGFYIPWDPATAQIVLRSGSTQRGTIPANAQLAIRNVSKNPPSVSLISPKGGEKLSGQQTISWQGSDADGDNLTYSVWYSPDDGGQWLPLDVNLTGNSTTVNFDNVPGSDKALIRVLASDGVNTTEARLTAPVIVPRHAPQVTISAPQDGATFNTDQEFLVSATSYDWEDGAITDAASYNWHDELGNNLGASPWTSTQLKPGPHTLTVSVKDSDGNISSSSVHVTITGANLPTPTPQPTVTPNPNPRPDSRFFPETGHTVKGRFLDYWNIHGGLAQQGYPLSDEFQEKNATDGKVYTVQYFERAVFEYHPENQPPYDVLLSLLGNFHYQQKYPSGATKQTPNASPGSIYYPQTGHRLGGIFLDYWQTHGGLAQQGYPISDEFTEVSELNGKPYLVQYFERAVFEYHTENKPPYNVLLSQLGTFQYKQRYGGQ